MTLSEEERKARRLEYQRKYRNENREMIREKEREYRKTTGKESQQSYRERIGNEKVKKFKQNRKKYFKDLLIGKICSICGFDNILALEYHHVDHDNKSSNVSKLIADGRSIEVVLEEISKCILVCGNCHAAITAQQQNRGKKLDTRTKLYREYLEHKNKLSCQECGFNKPECLQFHHIDPTQKVSTISRLANIGRNRKQELEDEISKCIVLCANCHRINHLSEGI